MNHDCCTPDVRLECICPCHNAITELDKAELTHECREMYKDIGFHGCLSALSETLLFGQTMIDVLREEYKNEFGPTD